MATGPREPTRGEREEKSGAGAREEVRRREEVSPVGAVPECPFLCAQGVGLDPTVSWVSGEWRCLLSFFFSSFFLLFIVVGFGWVPSSLCHHRDLPQNTPSRAKENKAIVGVGSPTPNQIPSVATVNS